MSVPIDLLRDCRALIDALAKRDNPDLYESDKVEDAERLIRHRNGAAYWAATVLTRLDVQIALAKRADAPKEPR